MTSAQPEAPQQEDTRRLLPAALDDLAQSLVGKLAKTDEARDLWVMTLLAALVFIPWLGSVGLWDPWEPGYGEVAREMVWRHDYVYPWWSIGFFSSKPAGLMWLTSIGMNLVGVNDNPLHTPLPRMTEWFVRMPVTLTCILGLVVFFLAVRRVFGRRLAFLTGFVMVTSPFVFFISRQAMPDGPLVACLEICLGAFMIAEFTERPGKPGERANPVWWYVMYAFAGFSVLMKESLGVAVPGLIILAYLVVSGDWELLKRARLLPGALVFLGICGPWYYVLSRFNGLDDQFKTFTQNLVSDNLDRFFSQVHTTTPAWNFTYYIRELGWGFFPWIAVLPGAMLALGKVKRTAKDPQTRATLFFGAWAVSIFTMFSFSGTKFYYYVYPVLPALAVLVALYADRLWREGVDNHWFPILLGAGLLALVASNLYVWHDEGGVHSGLRHFVDLFTYNYTRPYPYGMDNPEVFAWICGIGGGAAAVALLWRSKGGFFAAFGGLALAVAIWGSWFFWRAMSPHWSQRDEFWALYGERLHNEPITGFILGEGWRGETFYGRNTIVQINDAPHLLKFLSQPGPEYVIVEQARFNIMRQALGDKYNIRIVDRSSNKFFLCEVN